MFRISGHGDHRCAFPQPSPEASGGLHRDLCGSVAAVGHLPMPKAMAGMGFRPTARRGTAMVGWPWVFWCGLKKMSCLAEPLVN